MTMDQVIKLRNGVHEILGRYGIHDPVQKGLCSLELIQLITETICELRNEKVK